MAEQARPRQRKFAPRSRQGCLTCRARRKRCDNQRPDCSNCIRLNMKCEWQAQKKIISESSSASRPSVQDCESSTFEMLGRLQSSIDPWDALPGDEVAERNHLLQYYIEAFVPSVSVATTPSCFYTSLYIPWAFQSTGMLDAILAMSSAQLARRTPSLDRAQHLRDLSAKHQTKCRAFIRDRISPAGNPLQDTYQVMGITLLLIGLEALNGTKSTTWLDQLTCVRKILSTLSLEQSIMDCWEVDSIRRHFTYYAAMASLMSRVSDSQTLQVVQVDLDLSPHCAPGMPLTIDPLMGISYYLCALISRIQYITSPEVKAFPHITAANFHAIERDIKTWTYESPLTQPGVDLPVGLDLIALAEAYRLAALIQLYRTSENKKMLVPGCASRAMQFISRIPAGSPAESSMLYPIFLAGAGLEEEGEIEKCYKRLNEIQARNCYENVGMVQKVLEEVWKPKLTGGDKRDWEDVLREWRWSFSLG